MISGCLTRRTQYREPRTVAKSTKDSKPALNSKLVEKILAEIKEEEIVAMCCDVINIPSATGEELHMAEYMQAVLRQLELAVTWQEVEDGRANVIGRWNGRDVCFVVLAEKEPTGRWRGCCQFRRI